VPLVLHHGRTGASEASKVFGDDAASFARNSKVLYGWLRSQINIAPAGQNHPGTVIVGCGKNNNGPRWEPFAAQLDEETMTYHRIPPQNFDLSEWEKNMATEIGKRKKPTPTSEQVIAIIRKSGGSMRTHAKEPSGLMQTLFREGFSRDGVQQKISQMEADGELYKAPGKNGMLSYFEKI